MKKNKVYVVTSETPEDFQNKLNEAGDLFEVFATQVKVVSYGTSPTKFRYTGVLWYSIDQEQTKIEPKKKEVCKDEIDDKELMDVI